MKKTIRDNIFAGQGKDGAPLLETDEGGITVAGIYVDKNGARGLTIEEQVGQLRTFMALAKDSAERASKRVEAASMEIVKLKKTISTLKKRLRSKKATR